MRRVLVVAAAVLAGPAAAADPPRAAEGYRGIWFSIGQGNEHGPKYSGGLGTYTCSHAPMAVYVKAADKTFFTWGGTGPDGKGLVLMAAHYDHATGRVPRPTAVRDCGAFADPHADPSLAVDADGHVWVFASQRHALPGQKYRSKKPLDVSAFDLVETKKEFAYAAAWPVPGKGLFVPFTRYTGGRELYWTTLPERGTDWSPDAMLATGGHYHVTGVRGTTVGIAFNWHPGGDVDKRTNLYYLETPDFGATWRTAAGTAVRPPVKDWPTNPALAVDTRADGRLLYTHDLAFDADGRPVVLYLTSGGAKAGPGSGERRWETARWTGAGWERKPVATSDHNYDTGCLHVEADGTWRVIGPTDPGPQPGGTGGDMVVLVSTDRGGAWRKTPLTGGPRNHSYARRPADAHPGFYAFWADGDPTKRSESRLYFATKDGKVYRLPADVPGADAAPELVPPAAGR
ncbi:MAG: hypothetical protein C0501_27995 [Isosphaera sp.]|nr:hypothetical protein [Isosphaera sp.]